MSWAAGPLPEMHCPHLRAALPYDIREGCLFNKKGECGNGWIAATLPSEDMVVHSTMDGTVSDRIFPNYIRERKAFQGLQNMIFATEAQRGIAATEDEGR